ncbi:alpha-hydroxy-acid oxidizing protein [Lyngbya sp. CCY1209]|uniref:alpha-hydroxy-acid oxidizing protein n=1 Tax=Lyngbya sp. CCY1209 TaxID=2886103 RepID=UPI002D2151AB|nr:alpha-hydroxy-acid oxidizing protein [Lyngbya sp. CCY1209]MEB3884179.1 alpha-hydroxy-acid oxidizing protein [Lyngbya sp. CCY1209]
MSYLSTRSLEEVAAAVGDTADILIDGGIRRGTDILKIPALGAKAVWVGRPVWGLAANEEAGVGPVWDGLRDELDVAMALSCCRAIAHIDGSWAIRIRHHCFSGTPSSSRRKIHPHRLGDTGKKRKV